MAKFEFTSGERFVAETQVSLINWYGFSPKIWREDVIINQDVFTKEKNDEQYVCTEFNEEWEYFKMKKIKK